MTRLLHDRALLVAAALLAAACVADDDPGRERLIESRELTARFGATLKGELKEALSSGGPTAAITVCKERAPLIAAELSRLSGAKVRRTSLRYRNPANAPEPWETKVLANFDELAAREDAAPELEYHVELDDGTVRYMAAIETQGVCLACHGSTLAGGVDEALQQDYPHDRARGYAAGDIRGAFSVTWPAPDGERRGTP
ncbi:MAG: DUF3365 domain-containing protein [Gammaproteobacteria bacterium]|nr:DUF3365 domain-containing protein [Gammaproteobacteria bacterium]